MKLLFALVLVNTINMEGKWCVNLYKIDTKKYIVVKKQLKLGSTAETSLFNKIMTVLL